MPSDLAHLNNISRGHPRFRGKATLQFAANSNLSVQELLFRNSELAIRNRQLTLALARLKADAGTAMTGLTQRQQQVMALVVQGHPSKNIAADLNISQRTVENHRAAIMRRTGAASLPALVRLSLAAK
jgi:two-component system CheB/CheR fusion protein